MFRRRWTISFGAVMVLLLILQPAYSAEIPEQSGDVEFSDVPAVEWALLTATNMGMTGEPDAIFVIQPSFEQLQDLLTGEEIANAARDTGASPAVIRALWARNGLKAIYAVENEWNDVWTVVDLIGGIQYQPTMGDNRPGTLPTYDRLRLFFVKGSLVGETGLFSDDQQVEPWGTLIDQSSRLASEITLQVSVAHLEAARTWAQKDVSPTDTSVWITEETSTAFCYYCEYAPCNVVLQVEHDVKGTSANLRVGDPALWALNEFDAWSASRVTAASDVQGVWAFVETGWMKWLCFTHPGCPRYGSWKNLQRHFWVRRNANGAYTLFDVANTQVGLNQAYKVENEFIGPPWNVWGWSAWVEQTKFVSLWTGFSVGTDNWYGAETPDLGGYPYPLNGMDTTVTNARYRATNLSWYDVGWNYQPLDTQAVPPYWVNFIYGGAQIGGCN